MPNPTSSNRQPRAAAEALTYTVPTTRRITGLGSTKIYELIGSGALRAMKCGGRTLICARSLRAYLDSLPALPSRTA